jgi:hypothetical protein
MKPDGDVTEMFVISTDAKSRIDRGIRFGVRATSARR